MADLWGGILSIDQKQISIHDNFFELGGHSLLLSKLALAIETFFLVNIKLSDLFNNPTITHQIRLIHDIRNNSKSPKMPDISALPKRKMAPVSLAQRRLWLFQGLNPDTATYNIPRLFKLTGDLNAIALEASFQKMIKQYEILRTNFCEMNEQILQIIHSAKNVNFSLNYIDAFGYSHSSIMDLIYRETHKPFKLGEDLLIKASVYKKSENEYLLYICIHHIIFDGWSFDQFYKGLSTLYKSSLLGIENSSQTPSLQYADFSCWQKKILKGHYMKKQEDYWKNKLKNIPVTELPTDFVKSTAQTYNGRQFYFDLSSQLMNDLLNIAKNTSSSLFTVLFSAFDVLIYRYNQQTDIVVGTSIANRQHEKIQDMIGFFVNTLVLRSDLSNHPTFIQLIERNKEMLLEAYSNQEYPFEHLT